MKNGISDVRTAHVGGLPIACLSVAETADLMISLSAQRKQRREPLFMTSANGEVIARCRFDKSFAAKMAEADLINADGQPLVFASRLFCSNRLPERVATTDLFDQVAARAEKTGVSFYLYGATEEVNPKTYQYLRRTYPRLRILGRAHGYHEGRALEARIDDINRAAPDILWIALGVPREQDFVIRWRGRLNRVGMIKTSGGLFDFASGQKARAPRAMQGMGLEWLFRLALEPRRLFWRYAVTNPVAFVELVRASQ